MGSAHQFRVLTIPTGDTTAPGLCQPRSPFLSWTPDPSLVSAAWRMGLKGGLGFVALAWCGARPDDAVSLQRAPRG